MAGFKSPGYTQYSALLKGHTWELSVPGQAGMIFDSLAAMTAWIGANMDETTERALSAAPIG